jgi:hypothetical protein
MPTAAIADLTRCFARPQLGVFVPDGSRRLVLAFTDAQPQTAEFYALCATLPARYLLHSLRVFFEHGLPTLLVPILSRSVLGRGTRYQQLTALEGLRLLFADEEWLKFYDEFDVRVNIYGEPRRLAETECESALKWIAQTCQNTASHRTHHLLYAIGESARAGQDIAEQGIAFFKTQGRIPTLKELNAVYYGEVLPTADFFIMTSKISGLGALPRFLVDGDTEAYFLPAAGPIGLTANNYRRILYDLLYARASLRTGIDEFEITPTNRALLHDYYERATNVVLGLGQSIGGVWVADAKYGETTSSMSCAADQVANIGR